MLESYRDNFKKLTFHEKHQVVFNIVGVTISIIIGTASFIVAYSQFQSASIEENYATLEKHRLSQVNEIKRSRQAFAVKAPRHQASKDSVFLLKNTQSIREK
jgi:hypothetical protein